MATTYTGKNTHFNPSTPPSEPFDEPEGIFQRAGDPGGTPGPVEMEDSELQMSHSSVVRAMRHDTYSAAWTRSLSRSSRALWSELKGAIQDFICG